jgi:hypothetical protein
MWLMTPSNDKIVKCRYTTFNKVFQNEFDSVQFNIDDDGMEYLVVFFDANDGGVFNQCASWLSKLLRIPPSGNFVIMRKKWVDGEETTIDIGMTPTEVKRFIQSRIN